MNHMREYGAVLERETFQLPQAGLFADLDEGAGSVSLSDEIRELGGSAQIAIITDWQRGLELERRAAMARLFREVTGGLGNIGLPDKLNHFRTVCSSLGLECPADLALLLQQV